MSMMTTSKKNYRDKPMDEKPEFYGCPVQCLHNKYYRHNVSENASKDAGLVFHYSENVIIKVLVINKGRQELVIQNI